jgi:hypothetical protein
MENVIVRFTTKWPPNLTSLVIARLGGSKLFSHCMTIIDGIAYEATMLHGCRAVPLEEAMQGVSSYQDMLVPINNKDAAIRFGQDQNGKGYDFAGAFGLPFLASEDWDDDSKWWCSELVFMQLGAGDVWLLDPDVVKRVTPAHLLMCNYKRTGLIKLKP